MKHAVRIAALGVATLAACTPITTEIEGPTIGFILVGGRDDLGYNHAVWEGSDAVLRAFPEADVLRTEHVPEDGRAIVALEELIAQGASVVFATSFGHLDAALDVARRHPDVTVLHQGGVRPADSPPNFGAYWGAVYEPVYLAGVLAGATTRSDRVGFVAAYPMPVMFANVNAFTLGARSVNPRARTHVAFTGAWCDPDAQRRAARRLVRLGADVLTQQQDCTKAVLREAEAAGVATVGYHADGSEVAPRSWLVGSAWNWGPTYVAIVRAALHGRFPESPYARGWRGRYGVRSAPFVVTELAPRVSASARAALHDAQRRLRRGGSPFDGPLLDRAGTVRAAAGTALRGPEIEQMDYFVRGVVGAIPGSAD